MSIFRKFQVQIGGLQFWLFIFFLFFLYSRDSYLGQSSTATISGTVVDQTEGVVPGVEVTIENTATSVRRRTLTNSEGIFTFPSLTPGAYKLLARRDGFAPIELKGVLVNVNDQRALRIQLKAGSLSETITVVERSPLLNEAPAVATVVDRGFVKNQPLNGRTFQTLIGLSPGVVFTPANVVTHGQFSVNGQRTSSNYFTVDGVSANFGLPPAQNLYEGGGGGVPSFSVQGGTNTLASVDAVQEFAIQTSTYAPEFGRQPGAQVSIATRSGTNELHGSVFDYLRNDVFDANNFFANANRLRKPALRQNDFGGVAGGPILLPGLYDGRNRTFFFASYEGLRLRQPMISPPMLVPSLAARERGSGIVKDLLNAYPLPTGPADPNNPDQAPFIGGYSNPSSLNATSIRIDHKISDKLTLFGRYNHAPSESRERAKFASASCVAWLPFKTQTFTLGATQIISPRTINDVRLNYSASRAAQIYFIDNFGGTIVPPASSLYPSFTSSQTGSFGLIGPSNAETLTDGLLSDNRQRQVNLVDNFSLTLGAHSLKLGFDYRRLSPVNRVNDFQRFFNPGNFSQLAAGFAASASVIGIDVVLRPIYNNYSAFAQDTWRLRPRLTLTYGLRYDVNPAPAEKNGNLPVTVNGLEDLANATLAPRGTRFYETTYGNVAPRFGISYQLFPNRGTIVRSGFGVFYDLGYNVTGSAIHPSFYPYGRRADFLGVPITSPQLSVQPLPPSPNPPYPRLFAYQGDYRLPYTLQYSLGIEQPIGTASTVSLSYVGASARHLGRLESLRNPTANFTRIDVATNNAISNYDALQTQYQRRLSKGLQALVSYTFAKSLDTVSEESIVSFQASAGRYDPRQDYGPSTFDVRHSLNGAVSYDLPSPFQSGVGRAVFGNFSVDSLFGVRTATPVNVQTGRDAIGLGFTTVSRPDVLPGVALYVEDPAFAGSKRFNPAAFDAAAPLAQRRQGTLGRNVLRGFPLAQLDLSLRRVFQVRERIQLQFRVDAFNVLNHPNFANPPGALTDPNFGRATQMLNTGLGGLNAIYQTGGPRSLQLALKLHF